MDQPEPLMDDTEAESEKKTRNRRPAIPKSLDVQAECQRYAVKTVDALFAMVTDAESKQRAQAARVLLEFAHGRPQSADKKPVKNRRANFNMNLAPSPDPDANQVPDEFREAEPEPTLERYRNGDAGTA
jgi:hypothetical protein